jgi:hypothetical protein
VKLSREMYTVELVSSTSDGDSVNTGVYTGLLARMSADERPWLVGIHCVSHRLELAIKDSILKQKVFVECNDFMQTLHYFFKNSGRSKRLFHKLALVEDVLVYCVPKVHGTRFVGHVHRGLDHLLKNWIMLCMYFENQLSDKKLRASHAKIRDLLKKLRSWKMLVICSLLKSILEIITTLSLQMEKGELQVCDILPAIDKTKARLNDDVLEASTVTYLEESCGFKLDDDSPIMSCKLVKRGHMRRLEKNREFKSIVYEGGLTDSAYNDASCQKLKEDVTDALNSCVDPRFNSFQSGVFEHLHWIDPANWTDTKTAQVP